VSLDVFRRFHDAAAHSATPPQTPDNSAPKAPAAGLRYIAEDGHGPSRFSPKWAEKFLDEG